MDRRVFVAEAEKEATEVRGHSDGYVTTVQIEMKEES
jgi:hypothetical protein